MQLATETLRALRQREDVADEIEAMEREAALEKSSKKFSVLDIVRNKGNCAFFVAWGGRYMSTKILKGLSLGFLLFEF